MCRGFTCYKNNYGNVLNINCISVLAKRTKLFAEEQAGIEAECQASNLKDQYHN